MKNKNTWKAIIAVILVVASLTSMASLVSAGWVEHIFDEMSTYNTSSSTTAEQHVHIPVIADGYGFRQCGFCGTKTLVGQWVCGDENCKATLGWAAPPRCSLCNRPI